MCGPKQLFFQCGPETPKVWTALCVALKSGSGPQRVDDRHFYGCDIEFWEPVAMPAGVEYALLSLGRIQGFHLLLPDLCRVLWVCQSLRYPIKVAIAGIIKKMDQLRPGRTKCISQSSKLAQATSLFPPPACNNWQGHLSILPCTTWSSPLPSLPSSFPPSVPQVPSPTQPGSPRASPETWDMDTQSLLCTAVGGPLASTAVLRSTLTHFNPKALIF